MAAAHALALRTGGRYEAEYRVTGAGSVERWLFARGDVEKDSEGRAVALSGVAIDVTERKAAEAALEAERVQFRRLLDQVPAHIVTLRGPELRYEFANRAFLEFIGRDADFLGQRAEDAWPVPPEHLAMLRGILETGEPVVGSGTPVESPRGGLAFFDFAFLPLGEPDGAISGVFVHSLDVTEKLVAQEALRQSEERFRAAQETTPDAFSIIESVRDEAGTVVDFRWVYTNPAAEALAATRKEELIGASVLKFRPGIRENGIFDAYVRVVETGEPHTRELPMGYGGIDRYLRLTAVRVGDGVGISFSDISDRRRAEENLKVAVAERTKELEEAVAEAERFNYSISHDLRTPLRAMSMTSNVLLEELGDALSAEHRELLVRQAHNAGRLGSLIDALLRLSRLGRVAMSVGPTDVTALARASAHEIAQASGGNCPAVEIEEGMTATGDPGLVRLVLLNLLENACKFSPEGGTIRVGRVGTAFWVRDEGVGFDMAHAKRIFQPFERLVRDEEFAGTGIGLANVERIVRRHGGRVWAESEPGQGATFRFTLAP